MRSLHPILPFFASLLALSVMAAPAGASDNANGSEFFEARIRPVLAQFCYECHSSNAKRLQGGLRLDTPQDLQHGGDTGPAIVAGDADNSLLIRALKYDDFQMPPGGQLPASVIADFVEWVKAGAHDPRASEPGVARNVDPAVAAQFWSFQPVTRPAIPTVNNSDWPANEIDRFILARLEREGLEPTRDADSIVLLRRLYVDLIGLPPPATEIESWKLRNYQDVGSSARDETSQLVDRLLESRHFGERWGRHWLDLARYADSTGGGASHVLPNAWQYRNYVIRSFNEDKPYDQFVREQIAGDLLPWSTLQQRADQLIATGFLILGPRNYITDDATTFRLDGIDEQIDTLGQVFLAMTLGCARCHNHKFDPISARDYYALAGIFDSTQSDRPIPASKNYTWNTVADPRSDPDGEKFKQYEQQTTATKLLAKEITRLRRAIEAARASQTPPPGEQAASLDAWLVRQQMSLATLQNRKAALAPVPAKPATLMAVRCRSKTGDMQLRIRGNPQRPGPVVSRGFLQVLSGNMPQQLARPSIPPEQSGRLQLAEWITSRQHPLTARVIVNRVWHHMFGQGIVATVDNFGATGQAPTHPELLDWLAWKFVEEGWSVKQLLRYIIQSRTYRLGTAGTDSASERLLSRDPANRLFGRRTRRGLDAETLRDTILSVAGELDLTPGKRPFSTSLKKEHSHEFTSRRRSVYLPRFRNHQFELFRTFDGANPALVVGNRGETILPTQALYLINNRFVIEQSEKSAARLLDQGDLDDRRRIELMYLSTLARAPTESEMKLARQFVAASSDPGQALRCWAALQQTLFECVDFRFVK